MDGFRRARVLAWLVATALLAAACGSDSSADDAGAADAQSDTTTTSAVVEAEIDLDADPAAAATAVIDALDAEADAFVETTVQHIARMIENPGLEGAIDSSIIHCAEEGEVRAATVAALPESIGDIRIDDHYAEMRATYLEEVDTRAAACVQLTDQRDEFVADETQTLYTEWSMAIEPVAQAAELACLEALEPFAEYGRLNCYRQSDKQPSIDLGALADAQTNDADPLAGPTGGARLIWVEIPPGPAELAWFPRPFTIDHPEPLNLQTAEDYVWITEAPDGATFGLYALDAIADPAALELFGVTDTIPVPDDLSDWFDALPVTVTAQNEVEIGGAPATRWEFTPDREATIEATGDVSTALAASAVHDDIAIELVASFPERHILWHVRTGDGPVLIHVLDFGRELAFAESVLASISFG